MAKKTKQNRFLWALVFFLSVFGSTSLYALKFSDLTPAEKAVAQVMLSKRPRYSTDTTPRTLYFGKGEYEWAGKLTDESFARLCSVYPQLREQVEQGRAFRADYLSARIEQAHYYVHEQRGYDVNFAARLLSSYRTFLRSQSVAQDVKPDRFVLEASVRNRIERSRGYPPGLPVDQWAKKDREDYNALTEILNEPEPGKGPATELSNELFRVWHTAEVKRLEGLRFAPAGTPATIHVFGPEWPVYQYVESLLPQKSSARVDVLDLLGPAPPRTQASLLRSLEALAQNEEKKNQEVLSQHFRGWDRYPNKNAQKPAKDWLSDLEWHGYWQSLKQGKRKNPDWIYWQTRKPSPFAWFKPPTLEKLLSPETYAQKQKELWEKRITQLSQWSRRLGVVAALGLGLYHGVGPAWRLGETIHRNFVPIDPPWNNSASTTDDGPARPAFSPRKPPALLSSGEMINRMSNEKPLSENYAEGNTDPTTGMYRFVPKDGTELKDIPTEFELTVPEDLTSRSKQVTPNSDKVAFEVETGAAHEPLNGVVRIPSAKGYGVRTDVWADGKFLAPSDYDLMRTPDETYYLRLKHRAALVTYIAGYYKHGGETGEFSAPVSKLPPLELSGVAWLSALYREEGVTAVSDALDRAIDRALDRHEAIRPEEVIQLLSETNRYTHLPAKQLSVPPEPRNPLSVFRNFPRDKRGGLCLQCTAAAESGAMSVNIAWNGVPYFKAKTRGMIVRQPTEAEVYAGHRRIYVPLDQGFVALDPTPSKISDREGEEEKRAVEDLLAQNKEPTPSQKARIDRLMQSSLSKDVYDWFAKLVKEIAEERSKHGGEYAWALDRPPKKKKWRILPRAPKKPPPRGGDPDSESEAPPKASEPGVEKAAPEQEKAGLSDAELEEAAAKILEKRRRENLDQVEKALEQRRIANHARAEAEVSARKDRNFARDNLSRTILERTVSLANSADSRRLENNDRTYPHRIAGEAGEILSRYLARTDSTPENLSRELGEVGQSSPRTIEGPDDIRRAILRLQADIREMAIPIHQAQEDARKLADSLRTSLKATKQNEERIKAAQDKLVGGRYKYVEPEFLRHVQSFLDFLAEQKITPKEEVDYEKVWQSIRAANPEDAEHVLAELRKKNPEDIQSILAELRSGKLSCESSLRKVSKKGP